MRRRRAPGQFDSGGDEKALRQALHASLLEQRRGEVDQLPVAPAFRPTEEEWRDPLAYIALITPAAEAVGIARIVPPAGWRQQPFRNPVAGTGLVFETKRQELHRLQEGVPFGDVRGRAACDRGRAHCCGRFLRVGTTRRRLTSSRRTRSAPRHGRPVRLAHQCPVLTRAVVVQWLKEHPLPADEPEAQFLERSYWKLVEGRDEQVQTVPAHSASVADSALTQVVVDYANDLDTSVYGTGFGDEAATRSPFWDLNRLIEHPGNVLRAVDSTVPGVTRPWLYFGSLFTTFCWCVPGPAALPHIPLTVPGQALRGPLSVQRQLSAHRRVKDLVRGARLGVQRLREGDPHFRPTPV